MQPYVIKQGDHLLLLAYRFNFDADKVWNDPANEALRKVRSNPNTLWPTDVLYIPDPSDQPVTHDLVTGDTNALVATPPAVTVTIKFADPQCASQPCAVQELPELTGLQTDGSGSVNFAVPVTVQTFTVEFPGVGASYRCHLGGLDPVETLSGVFHRLQNLGYVDADVDPANPQLDIISLLRLALRRFAGTSSGATADDDAGLSSDGTLDAAIAQRLVAAHGS